MTISELQTFSQHFLKKRRRFYWRIRKGLRTLRGRSVPQIISGNVTWSGKALNRQVDFSRAAACCRGACSLF